jgi:hypothetical protein
VRAIPLAFPCSLAPLPTAAAAAAAPDAFVVVALGRGARQSGEEEVRTTGLERGAGGGGGVRVVLPARVVVRRPGEEPNQHRWRRRWDKLMATAAAEALGWAVNVTPRPPRSCGHYVKTSNRSHNICNGPLTPVTSTHICNGCCLTPDTYKNARTTPGLVSTTPVTNVDFW